MRQIYLDMDGVIADFVTSAVAIWGKTPDELDWPEVCRSTDRTVSSLHVPLGLKSEDELWEIVDKEGPDFWANLEPYPWREHLYGVLSKKAEVTIATSPSRNPVSALGKIRWLQEWKGKKFRNFIIIPRRKYLLAHKEAILIDDYDKHVKEFKEHGGHAILFPAPWNDAREFVSNPVDHVEQQLNVILETMDNVGSS